jgi:hypothetical protein
MKDDSYYYGELAEQVLSSSTIKLLLESPKKWKYVKGGGDSPELRVGKLFHTFILEPEKIGDFHFCSAKTAASKEYKDALLEHEEVFTGDDLDKANRLVDAFHRNEQAKRMVLNAEYEVPAIGEIHGIPFRAKADVLRSDGIVDLKTTSGGVRNFKYSADKYGYDVQVYIYCQLFNISYDQFKFLVIDKGTLDLAIFDVSEEFYLNGEAKTHLGIETYLEWKDRDVDEYILTGTL